MDVESAFVYLNLSIGNLIKSRQNESFIPKLTDILLMLIAPDPYIFIEHSLANEYILQFGSKPNLSIKYGHI